MSVPTLSSSSQLSINGILGSNVKGTEPLTSFPTSPTGNSVGVFHHLGVKNDGNNEADLLNASGTQQGGFNFWNSNSTQSPKLLASIKSNGVSVGDTNITSGGVSIGNTNLRNSSLSVSNGTNTSDIFIGEAVFSDLVNNRQALIYPFKAVFQNNLEGFATSVEAPLSPDYNSFYTGSGSDGFFTIQTVPQNPILTLNDCTGNTAVLTKDDLVFNNSSIVTNINTNTSNISANTDAINALQNELSQQIVTQLTFSSAAIYADSSIKPATNSSYQSSYGVFGWYCVNSTANTKFNFYFPPKLNMTVADLKGVYYQMFNNCVSLGDMPFITIYTQPTGTNDFKSWYHSSYTIVPSVLPGANSFVQCFGNLQNLSYTPDVWGNYSQSPLVASSYQPIKGDYQPTQKILFVALGSNSASSVNALNCSLLKFGMIGSFTNEWLLM